MDYTNLSNERLMEYFLKMISIHGEVWSEYRPVQALILQRMTGGEGWAYFDDVETAAR